MHRSSIAVLTATLALGAAAPASAGEPFTVGEGKQPHLTVDPASGAGHVVWHNDVTDRVVHCRVPRGATACDVTTELSPGFDPGPSFVLRDGAALRIVMPHYVANKTYMWTSADGGATWGAMQLIYAYANQTDPTEPVAGPVAGEITFASWNPGRAIWGARTDGSESAATARAELPGGGVSGLVYDLHVAPTTDGGLVATANDLDQTYFWRMNPSLDPSVPGSWSAAPAAVGPLDESRLAGGSSGTFLFGANGARAEIRKFNGSGFDAPLLLAGETPYINDVHVGPSGAVAALWRANDTPSNRLKLALSTDGGASFGVTQIAREDTVMAGMDVALASDNGGFATYQGKEAGSGAKNFIRVADLTPVTDPVVAPPAPAPVVPATPAPPALYGGPVKKKVVSGHGAKFTLSLPKSCIPAGTPFRVRLTWAKRKRKGNKFVKVTRSDFYIGKTRVKKDTKAPFTQVLTIASPRKGASYTLKARAFIKVKRGRSPKKSITSALRVCST